MKKTMTVLLGLRDKVESNFKNMLTDMAQKFSKKQGLFLGEKKTYQALDSYADDPTKRGFTNVQSTVEEQLGFMQQETKDFMNVVFSIEKTNASGNVVANLIVDGEDWGEYTSLELLRLKTTLDNSRLKEIYQHLPVRTATDIWSVSEDENHADRAIFQTELDEGHSKTTLKESYILPDPHAGEGTSRPPIVADKSTQVNVGRYTVQKFSGAISMKERANMIVRYNSLYKAVVVALAEANQVEAVQSDLGTKVFEYIHS